MDHTLLTSRQLAVECSINKARSCCRLVKHCVRLEALDCGAHEDQDASQRQVDNTRLVASGA